MPINQVKYSRCESCGAVPYLTYPSALGLTPKQQEDFNQRRYTCAKCGGPAKPMSLEQVRRAGLDGKPGYVEETPAVALLDMLKDRGS